MGVSHSEVTSLWVMGLVLERVIDVWASEQSRTCRPHKGQLHAHLKGEIQTATEVFLVIWEFGHCWNTDAKVHLNDWTSLKRHAVCELPGSRLSSRLRHLRTSDSNGDPGASWNLFQSHTGIFFTPILAVSSSFLLRELVCFSLFHCIFQS